MKKNLIPNNDPGLFDLQIDGVTDPDADGIGHNGSTGEETVNTGNHTVGEASGSGATDLADYDKSIVCVDTANQNQQVAATNTDTPGPLQVNVTTCSDIICTVTNTREGAPTAQLTVIKHVINDDGGTAVANQWQLHATEGGSDVPGSPKPGNEAGESYTFEPGNYAVSETGGPSGYAATISGDCDPQTGAVTLNEGDDKTCTITNDDIPPTLTVIKHVINDSGTGTSSAGDFGMVVDDPGNDHAPFPGAEAPGTTIEVDPGAYSVSEFGPSGYAQSLSADCSVQLALGEQKTCTITNDDIPAEGGVLPERRSSRDVRRPTVGIIGVGGPCVSRDFMATVSIRDASRMRSVTVKLDGRVIKRTKQKRF